MRTIGAFSGSWLELLIVSLLAGYLGAWLGHKVASKILKSMNDEK